MSRSPRIQAPAPPPPPPVRRESLRAPLPDPVQNPATVTAAALSQLNGLQVQQQQAVTPGASNLPNLSPTTGSRQAFNDLPVYSGLAAQNLANSPTRYGPPEDLSTAMVHGRPLDTRAPDDLFWHYFGGRAAPTNREESLAFQAELQQKLGPFGFKIESIDHERMDKFTITGPDGKVENVDFVYAMGGKPGEQRLQWLGSNPTGPTAAGGTVDESFVMGILTMFPPTNDGIKKALEALKKNKGYENARILEHPERLDKIDFGNGQVFDVIVGAGGPNPSWGWMPE